MMIKQLRLTIGMRWLYLWNVCLRRGRLVSPIIKIDGIIDNISNTYYIIVFNSIVIIAEILQRF